MEFREICPARLAFGGQAPRNSEALTGEAPLPQDFAVVLEYLRKLELK